MPSFDIVSEITMHEVRNAVENANRELTNRWDFRNVTATIELNEGKESIKLTSESDFQVEQLLDILRNAMIKRSIEPSSLEIPDDYEHSGKMYSKEVTLKQGIEKEMAKKIIKLIKDAKLKVQTQIQGEQVRVTGKSRDDLQKAIQLVKGAELGQPFQFENFRD
ncbi:YajQ family cyclic di-GMP-binding protein [Pasteurella atlantica]|uniref:YajQ family cyclic di-GMP-binding protein n=2 Tax=Pasteurellaceae TaxID=712 RepID=A0ACC6HLX0_9PAST|nr:YajQ family cyclic di-GMP-binding protein [Pasteurella atlantica]MDP8051847.1 YajQ family cyclic di-GMP-binding protein [Pasteurella atlantica]MDP8099190.1 YajQ family cyclic di-GMP-binding protein [Pasteurella atlantica]MDP8105321.1 YajQ family cyclic di-GMP-binding protein [Pasteurella atlantica]MDP8107216.1 YajQ family cyclic di-GMP-binding protein [Pasteurella atlantica]MDP8116907.1 YajQ family cyclic di-GMP-binding protein [Pasteurella atlantica]